MNLFRSEYLLPLALAGAVAVQGLASRGTVSPHTELIGYEIQMDETPSENSDTVIYSIYGYRRGWTEEEFEDIASVADSLLKAGDTSGFMVEDYGDSIEPVFLRPPQWDSIVPPDSLRILDTFRFKYYPALVDSACHIFVRDSLLAAGDSSSWFLVDSIYLADSAAFALAAYQEWYNSLSPKERRRHDNELLIPVKQARMDSIDAVKDSIKAVKDSILKVTPRILDSYVFKDSLQFQRIITWTRNDEFSDIKVKDLDTSFNYHFRDYPFKRNDVNATWLGVAGSPLQTFNFFKRESREDIPFYDALESWSYAPSDLPMYNTKTPYTELAYWGTLLSGSKKESDNLHLMTSQNISPALNITLLFNRYGGNGILQNESTANKTMAAYANYLGWRYTAHAGVINNIVTRQENGGIQDNFFIRDTTVDAREIEPNLLSGSSDTRKKTYFLDQQFRIPFYFIQDLFQRKSGGEDSEEGEEDSNDFETVTTAFIGHSSEYSVYSRKYLDELSTEGQKNFYKNSFNYNPSSSNDSIRVSRLDNRLYIRLQPWSETSIVSKLDLGAGYKHMKYHIMDRSYLRLPLTANWNSLYMYAGANGQFKEYFKWDALGHLSMLGSEAGDFDINANAQIQFFPFRKARKSPISINLHFGTSLKEPDYYQQHFYSNHYAWDNEFNKISTTKIRGEVSIPRWRFSASAGYALLANNIYFDSLSTIRQNTKPMSIFSATLNKDFVIAKLIHLDHRALFQLSSDPDVLPLPMVALNARYYLQFNIKKILDMQIGADIYYNTSWYLPAYNPALGTFFNQKEQMYGNAPYFDIFLNMQWKRACIFIKYENTGQGWPLDRADYFSAHHYINTQRAIKLGIWWPFYTMGPGKSHSGGGEMRSGGSGKQQAVL